MVEFDKNKNYKTNDWHLQIDTQAHNLKCSKNGVKKSSLKRDRAKLMINLRNFICSTGKKKNEVRKEYREENDESSGHRMQQRKHTK